MPVRSSRSILFDREEVHPQPAPQQRRTHPRRPHTRRTRSGEPQRVSTASSAYQHRSTRPWPVRERHRCARFGARDHTGRAFFTPLILPPGYRYEHDREAPGGVTRRIGRYSFRSGRGVSGIARCRHIGEPAARRRHVSPDRRRDLEALRVVRPRRCRRSTCGDHPLRGIRGLRGIRSAGSTRFGYTLRLVARRSTKTDQFLGAASSVHTAAAHPAPLDRKETP